MLPTTLCAQLAGIVLRANLQRLWHAQWAATAPTLEPVQPLYVQQERTALPPMLPTTPCAQLAGIVLRANLQRQWHAQWAATAQTLEPVQSLHVQ